MVGGPKSGKECLRPGDILRKDQYCDKRRTKFCKGLDGGEGG